MTIQKNRAAWFAPLAVVASIAVQSNAAFAQDRAVESSSAIAFTPETPDTAQVSPVLDRKKQASVFSDLFAPLGSDFRGMATQRNLLIAGIVGAGAAASHRVDSQVASTRWPQATDGAFKPGQFVGNFLIQTSGAAATYAVGRMSGSPRVARTGAELFRAQVVAQTTAQAIKFATGRTRPDGTAHSFPSGHTASAFATATVLQAEFGWKVAAPAYGIATWVAASRVEAGRHFVSDVVAGAAVGILAGRSVTIGSGKARFSVSPMATPGGGGVSFTKVSK